jgi:large subunit ribosomal protein LP0
LLEKNAYFEKLIKLIDEYPKIFIVGCDNVGSAQMAKIRHALRGKAVVLMGKKLYDQKSNQRTH